MKKSNSGVSKNKNNKRKILIEEFKIISGGGIILSKLN